MRSYTVATKQEDGTFIIAAGEVGAYTVCPESWKLKWIDREKGEGRTEERLEGIAQHRAWSDLFEESIFFSRWSRYLATLLCAATLIFLLLKRREQSLLKLFDFSSGGTVFELLLIVCASIIVIRILLGEGRGRTEATGLAPVENTLSVDGSQTLPGREYVSKRQGLAGKPDALIKEDGFLVPIEMKPLAKKLRDRYVAQLLVYMRLVEEFEGKSPPYGYLLLGASRRRVKVVNSAEKQRWVDSLLVEMREVLLGQTAKATPHPTKCEKCDVRSRCQQRYEPQISLRDVADSKTKLR